jgi:hypothetical protein
MEAEYKSFNFSGKDRETDLYLPGFRGDSGPFGLVRRMPETEQINQVLAGSR